MCEHWHVRQPAVTASGASRCHHADMGGGLRGLIAKISRLADDGEKPDAAARARIETAQTHGLSAVGVQTMQAAERELVSTAVELELINTITERELERLREDRHLCVHPSLRGLGEPHEPRTETARAHLAAPLDGLLTLPQPRVAQPRSVQGPCC